MVQDGASTVLAARLPRTVMIKLGEGWVVENGRFFHACGPEVVGPLCSGHARCDCGAHVPRRVRLFRAWFARGDDSEWSTELQRNAALPCRPSSRRSIHRRGAGAPARLFRALLAPVDRPQRSFVNEAGVGRYVSQRVGSGLHEDPARRGTITTPPRPFAAVLW